MYSANRLLKWLVSTTQVTIGQKGSIFWKLNLWALLLVHFSSVHSAPRHQGKSTKTCTLTCASLGAQLECVLNKC